MKAVAILMCLIMVLLLTVSCGSDKTIDGHKYETYGLLTKDTKDPDIKYKPIWGNVIWGCLLFETIIAPVYFFGFSMYEPVGRKAD